jgi:hypothetical protein
MQPAAMLATLSLLMAIGVNGVGVPSGMDRGRPREPYGQCWSTKTKKFSSPCGPENEMCGPPVKTTAYHIMDRSCPGGDTDFPFFDEVHGVYVSCLPPVPAHVCYWLLMVRSTRACCCQQPSARA